MQTSPAPRVEQVLDGLWSIPVPIPGSPLPYVLAFAFAVPGGVVLVDPGWNTPDPLADYLASLERLRPYGDGDALVLPGHQRRFRGLAGRVDELLAHHQERLDEAQARRPPT